MMLIWLIALHEQALKNIEYLDLEIIVGNFFQNFEEDVLDEGTLEFGGEGVKFSSQDAE
jgi:hypothetical protein